MADLQTLENAFLKAHKAGDTNAAGTLAAEIKRMRNDGPIGDPSRGAASNSTMNMLTMGAMPKINAAGGSLIDSTIGAIKGEGFNYSDNYNKQLAQQRADQDAYEAQNPVKSFAGKAAGIAGGMAMLPAAAPFKSGLANAITTGAAYGGAGGAIQDANSMGERGKNILKGGGTGAAMGAVAYPVIKGIAWGVGKVLGPKNAPALTTENIKAQSQAAYKEAENFGVKLDPQGYSGLVDDITGSVITPGRISEKLSGVTDSLHPASKKLVEGLQQTKGMELTLDEVWQIRNVANEIAGQTADGRPTKDAAMGMKILDKIDDFVSNLSNQPMNVSSGDAAGAVAARDKATGLWRQMIQSSKIDRALLKADVASSTNYSQAGHAQAVKREFSKFLLDPRFTKTFTPEQQQAIQAVVEGGPIENIFRHFGKMAPSGGLSQMMHLGSALQSGGLTVPLSAATAASQYGSAQSTLGKASLADALTKGGAPSANPVTTKAQQMMMQLLGPSIGNMTNRQPAYGARRPY